MGLSEYSKRLKQWNTSEDYAKQYVMFQSIVDHIMSVYKLHKDKIDQMTDQLDEIAVHKEIGSVSDMHRRYYCPSLTHDIVVGNVDRGRLLKRLTPRSKRYFVYGYDHAGRMIWCKEFSNASLVNIETFIYEGEYRYGFTQNMNHPMFAITQEKFQNGRIVNYLYGHGYHAEEEMVWVEWRQECYHYDEIGLKSCDVFRVCPTMMDMTHDKLIFNRDNGYLKNYYRETLIGLDEVEVIRTGPIYNVLTKRKA